ncbi:MAG TPA: cytochrome P450 [Pseudonocardiaceae bacterium]|jgi:cytochrome P450|nr:cytochrome P450 [Pseudonocardiaceae bacterium]
MLVAGTETSISGISNIMHCALRWLAVAADSPVSALVKESLRWEPPLHSVIRFAMNDVVIEGARIARRRPVLLVIASANRDESVFADAERFDPVRDGRQAIPFGVGQHACPGSFLAEREFNALFSALTAAFQITVASDQFTEIHGHVFRRPRTLPVRASQAVSPNPREVVKS